MEVLLMTHSIDSPSRRIVLVRTLSGVCAAFAVGATRAIGQTPQPQPPADIPKRPGPLAPSLVEEFVRKAHVDLPATRALLTEHPSLLNATWDWGGGDFETGLGGASHMGTRDVAEFLISHGARMDIFAAAMLGRLEILKAMLTAYPGLLHSKGPHGIPLMAHAKKGGAAAEPVVVYLESLGLRSAFAEAPARPRRSSKSGGGS
jgi:hypothetical protein